MTSRRTFIKTLAATGAAGAGALTYDTHTAAAARIRPLVTPPTGQRDNWVTAWGTAFVPPDTTSGTTGPSTGAMAGYTYRNIVRPTISGTSIRLRLSNLYASAPLPIGAVTISEVATGANLKTGTTKTVTFGGTAAPTIAPEAILISDAITYPVTRNITLAVDIYYPPTTTGPLTWTPSAWNTSYISTAQANACGQPGSDYTTGGLCLYTVDSLDVYNTTSPGAVVCLGASTTTGFGTAPDTHQSYPDALTARIQALKSLSQHLAVVNAGIIGNRLCSDDNTNGLNGQARFLTDVVTRSKIKAVLVWLGTDDITTNTVTAPDQLTAGWTTLTNIARACNILVFGATLQPIGNSDLYTPTGEALRQAANSWIRKTAAFDDIYDFDQTLRDPTNPTQMLPAYASSDWIHPNAAGYKAIANTINLNQLLALTP